MNSHVVIPVLIAFVISLVLGPVVIPFLRRLKMGQTERVEGVQSHLKKAGTPTMGGIIILAAVVITSLFYVKDYPKIIPVLFLTVGFGLIGFLDDYLKVVMKRSDGLFHQRISLLFFSTDIHDTNCRILLSHNAFHINGSHLCKLYQVRWARVYISSTIDQK